MRRRLVAWEIQNLSDQVKANPNDTQIIKQLALLARSKYSFKATLAAVEIGNLGLSSRPVILDLSELLNSSDPFVSREAANSLSKLGPISEPALKALEAKVRYGDPYQDTTWFSAEALGNIGKPARHCIPLLRSKLGSGSRQFEFCLKKSLELLEGE
jgi:HEAT repeat protein